METSPIEILAALLKHPPPIPALQNPHGQAFVVIEARTGRRFAVRVHRRPPARRPVMRRPVMRRPRARQHAARAAGRASGGLPAGRDADPDPSPAPPPAPAWRAVGGGR